MSVGIKSFVCGGFRLKNDVCPDEKHIYSIHQIKSQNEYWLIDLLGLKQILQKSKQTTQPNKMENVFTKLVKSFSVFSSPVLSHTGGEMYSRYFKEK